MILPFWNIPELQSRKLSRCLERSLRPICVYDDRGRTVYASQSFLELLQTQAAQANFFDCFPSALRAKLAKFWQQALIGETIQFIAQIKDVEATLKGSLEFDETAKLMFFTAARGDVAEDTNDLARAYENAVLRSAHSNLATALINPNGDVIQCNQNLHSLLGTSEQDVINLEQFVHPDDHLIDELLKQDLLNGAIDSYAIEKRFVSRNYELLWLKLNVSVLEAPSSENGYLSHFAVILEDITDHKKIYSTLVRTEEKWKTLFLNSPYLFIQTSSTGQIIHVSPAVEALLGYQPEELLGYQIRDLIHPSNLNEVNLALQLWSNDIQAKPTGIECWWRAKSNRWVALSIQGQRFPTMLEIDGLMISGHNITDRKALEIELRDNEEKFKSLVVNSLGAVFRCDSSYTMQFISDKTQEITGYPASVFINNQIRSYLSIVHPDDISILKDSLMLAILDHHAHPIEYRIIDANGQIRWVAERKQGFFSQNGDLLWIDGLLLEISNRTQLEVELPDWESTY